MYRYLLISALSIGVSACAPNVVEQTDEMSATTKVVTNALSTVSSRKTTNSLIGTVQVSHTELTAEGRKVQLKPLPSLKRYNGCVHVISLSYYVDLPYEHALIEIRNRGGLLGANAVGISDFIELNNDKTHYVGHFHKCSDLSKI